MLDFRVGSNWLILCLLNFESCQLWHQLSETFLHHFLKFFCQLCWKIPEFSKTPPTSYIWMNLKEVVTKNQKNKKSEKMPIWANPEMLSFFRVTFFNFFLHPYAQRVPNWKIAHNWQSKEHKNNKKTPKNGSHKGLQSLQDVLKHPVYSLTTTSSVKTVPKCGASHLCC